MVRISSHSIILFFMATLFILLLLPGTIGAQSTSARLEGTIWDPSDNPTPGVILTAVEERTGWQSETVSDENGRYLFLALRPGYYTVFTRARGFQQVTRRHIYLPVNGSVIESFTLDITVADETILTEEQIALDNSDMYQDLSSIDINSLPVFSRNPLILTAHNPGIQINGGSEEISTSNGARKGMNQLSLDGLSVSDPINPRLGTSEIALNTDTIDTIHLITSGANAEYGRAAGGQIGVVSKFGGNAWHGNVYDYISNESLDANDFFRNAEENERLKFRRNIFGGTISGPLMNNGTLVFGNYEGRRTDSEITRNSLVLMDDSDDEDDISSSDFGYYEDEGLNDEAKAGVFRWYTPGDSEIHLYDIVENDPRGLGIDPQVAAILAALPSPNNDLIGDGLNTGGYQFKNPTYNNADQVTARADHTLNADHRIFVRFNYNRSNATDVLNNADPVFPDSPEGTIDRNTWALSLGSHYTLNPGMVNELQIGYVRSKTELNRPARSTESMLLANSWTNPSDPDSPRAYLTPYLEISDSFSHSRDKHTFRYGGTIRRTSQKSVDYSGVYPDITFGSSMGNAPDIGPMGNNVISHEDRQTFENLYNDILGRVESVSQTYYFDPTSPLPSGSPMERSFTSYDFSAFIQDDWRIRPNLTLNLGLRWEYIGVPGEKNGIQIALDPSSGIDETGNISDFILVPGKEWRSRNISDFAPRVGFAWDITGYGTFLMRGSYGIFFDRPIGAITNYINTNTYGLSQTASSFPNLGGGDLRLSDSLPYPTTPDAPDLSLPATRSASIAILDPDLSTPRIDRFNLTLEKRLSNNLVVEASYVGARGRRLYQDVNLNQTKIEGDFLQAFEEIQEYRDFGTPVPESNTLLQIFGSPIAVLDAIGGSYFDAGLAGPAADVLDRGYYDMYSAAGVSDFYIRNYPQFDQLIVGTDTGRSWYDALQAGFRANSSSFRMNVYYTWSKSLDTLSEDGGEFVSLADSLNPKANKAPSDFDRNHIVNIMSSFNVPFGRDRRYGSEANRVLDLIFGDWEVGFLSVWQSGRRFSVSSGLETAYAGLTSLADYDGPDGIGTLNYRPADIYWFTPAEWDLFTTPAPGETGNSGRNTFQGPKYFNTDLTFFKPFQIGNNNRLLIRAEIYNLFNRPHFGVPLSDISNSDDFSKITSTVGTPRKAQVALRYEF